MKLWDKCVFSQIWILRNAEFRLNETNSTQLRNMDVILLNLFIASFCCYYLVPYTVKEYVKYPVHVPTPVEVIKKIPYEGNLHSRLDLLLRLPWKIIRLYSVYTVKVPVDKPYEVRIPVPKPYTVEKKIHVPVHVSIPQPYEVTKHVPYPVKEEIYVPKPYTVIKKVPYEVKVPVDRPYKVC